MVQGPEEERLTAWENQGGLLAGGDPGTQLRRKNESIVQRKDRKCVPSGGNCRHKSMEVGS